MPKARLYGFGPFSLFHCGNIWSLEAFGFLIVRRPGSIKVWRIVE